MCSFEQTKSGTIGDSLRNVLRASRSANPKKRCAIFFDGVVQLNVPVMPRIMKRSFSVVRKFS